MVTVKITLVVECTTLREYNDAITRLQRYAPTDGRFNIQTIDKDETNLRITVTHEPTLEEI